MRTIIFLALLLSGCSSWVKPYATESDFNNDMYACEKDAAPQSDGILRDRMMTRCMQIRGWREK
jgi:PBP1b-binding outer membrane lipoprotein LpoB